MFGIFIIASERSCSLEAARINSDSKRVSKYDSQPKPLVGENKPCPWLCAIVFSSPPSWASGNSACWSAYAFSSGLKSTLFSWLCPSPAPSALSSCAPSFSSPLSWLSLVSSGFFSGASSFSASSSSRRDSPKSSSTFVFLKSTSSSPSWAALR